MIGTVTSVRDDRLGGELTADAAIGATTLLVDWLDEFDEGGGQLIVGGLIYPYTALDDTALSLTLGTALTVAVFTGDWVAPSGPEEEGLVRVASVDVGRGEALDAVLGHEFKGFVPAGTRDPGAGEKVRLAQAGDVLRVVEVLGVQPVLVDSIRARSMILESDDSVDVVMTVRDKRNTGGNWSEWQTAAGATKRAVTNLGLDLLVARGTDPPAAPAGTLIEYSKLVAGVPRLFYIDDAGTVHGPL